MSELVALLKSKPDKLNFSSGGFGTPSHLTGELFKLQTGARVAHVPYQAMGQMIADLINVEWPRRLYGHLKAAGLTEVGMEGHLAVRGGGSPGASLDAANYAQVRREAVARGLVTDAEIDAVLARVDASDFAVFSPVMFTAWGRRPGFAASQSDHALPAG